VNTPIETPEAREQKAKKPYSKPTLQVYGGVLELTQAHNATGVTDGGTLTSGGSKTN
jgi:hypothetical protein